MSTCEALYVDFVQLLAGTEEQANRVLLISSSLDDESRGQDFEFEARKTWLRFSNFVAALNEKFLQIKTIFRDPPDSEDKKICCLEDLENKKAILNRALLNFYAGKLLELQQIQDVAKSSLENLNQSHTNLGQSGLNRNQNDPIFVPEITAQIHLQVEEKSNKKFDIDNRGSNQKQGTNNRVIYGFPKQPVVFNNQKYSKKNENERHLADSTAEDISNLASQLKFSANEINKTLKTQTALLEDTENIASKNLVKVKKEADRLAIQVRKKRNATFFTCFTILAVFFVFFFTYLFIIKAFSKRRSVFDPHRRQWLFRKSIPAAIEVDIFEEEVYGIHEDYSGSEHVIVISEQKGDSFSPAVYAEEKMPKPVHVENRCEACLEENQSEAFIWGSCQLDTPLHTCKL